MMVKGSDIRKAMNKEIIKVYELSKLSEREQELFLLGLKMGSNATAHVIQHKIPHEGAFSSYSFLIQILPLFKNNECFEGKWYWEILKKLCENL